MTARRLPGLSAHRKRALAGLFSNTTVALTITNFVRVAESQWVDPRVGGPTAHPLSYGRGSSRFSPVIRPSAPPPFGLIYAAADLATAVYEARIRARLDLKPVRRLAAADYRQDVAVNISSAASQPLLLLDLTQGAAVKHGVPTDVLRYSFHRNGQYFSEFIHSEMRQIDGFLYPSRFTEKPCVGIYDRAHAKLTSPGYYVQLDQPLLKTALTPWNVAVV